MTHRVHTILSILAEDHAPAALRPSILLAVDWPTVAEEAPATGDDAYIACVAAGLLGGKSTRDNLVSSLGALALIAARLATVAASLTVTGDKAMTAHATALWGAAAVLVGCTPTNIDPSTAEVYLRALARKANGIMFGISRTATEHAAFVGSVLDKAKSNALDLLSLRDAMSALATKAADLVPGAIIPSDTAAKAALIATAMDRVHDLSRTREVPLAGPLRDILGLKPLSNGGAEMKADHDKALADIHALRDILKVPEGGNLVDHASKTMDGFPRELLMTCASAAAKIIGATVSVHPAEQAGIIGEALRLAETTAAENTSLRAQVDRMITAMWEDVPPSPKRRPQPGDVVPWAEVEWTVNGNKPSAR